MDRGRNTDAPDIPGAFGISVPEMEKGRKRVACGDWAVHPKGVREDHHCIPGDNGCGINLINFMDGGETDEEIGIHFGTGKGRMTALPEKGDRRFRCGSGLRFKPVQQSPAGVS